MLPGETILSGAKEKCTDCGVVLVFKVMNTSAGHYVGTECACGPYSRETGYSDEQRAKCTLAEYKQTGYLRDQRIEFEYD